MSRKSTLSLVIVLMIPISLTVLSACGNGGGEKSSCASPDADCTLAETASEAGFFAGAAVPADPSDPRMDVVPLHFNSITAEGAMKWGELAGELGSYDFSQTDALLDFAEANDLRLRGHALVWGKFPGHGYPADLAERIGEAEDPEAFVREAIRLHISTVVGRYAGRVETWDVVNEPLAMVGSDFERNIFYEAMGPAYIPEAFHAAHEADPDVRLVLNEFFLDYDGPKTRAFVDLAADFIEQGVPIDGVGIQGHVFVAAPRPESLRSFLADLAELGLEIELTELDVTRIAMLGPLLSGRELFEAQADVYRDLAAACVDTPACRGITVWGIDDANTWFDRLSPFDLFAPHEPLLLDRSLHPKPAYYAVEPNRGFRLETHRAPVRLRP